MRSVLKISLLCLALGAFFNLNAQDMVYKPKNPAFGGDTFNYNWLLSSAQAQDLFSENRSRITTNRSTAENFANSLNSLLLSQLSRQIIGDQFGEDGLQDGTYTLGNFQVDVATTLEGLTITIFDQTQGESTQIVIPFF